MSDPAEPAEPCCDHDGSVTCQCIQHHPDEVHPNGTLVGSFAEVHQAVTEPLTPRYVDEVWALVQEALANYPHERILRGDVIFTVLPGPAGLAPVTMIYIEGAGVVLGTTMGLSSNPLQPPLLLRDGAVAEVVHMLIDGMRESRAAAAMEGQRPEAGTNGSAIDLSQFRGR